MDWAVHGLYTHTNISADHFPCMLGKALGNPYHMLCCLAWVTFLSPTGLRSFYWWQLTILTFPAPLWCLYCHFNVSKCGEELFYNIKVWKKGKMHFFFFFTIKPCSHRPKSMRVDYPIRMCSANVAFPEKLMLLGVFTVFYMIPRYNNMIKWRKTRWKRWW